MDTTPLTPDPRGGGRRRSDRRQDPAPLASTDRRAAPRRSGEDRRASRRDEAFA